MSDAQAMSPEILGFAERMEADAVPLPNQPQPPATPASIFRHNNLNKPSPLSRCWPPAFKLQEALFGFTPDACVHVILKSFQNPKSAISTKDWRSYYIIFGPGASSSHTYFNCIYLTVKGPCTGYVHSKAIITISSLHIDK